MDKKKVLVVDDDKEFLDEIANTLELSGYKPITVSDSNEVVKEASKVKPRIILLDLKLEGKSGFKVADELRFNPKTKDIPIVAITGVFTRKEHRVLMRVCNMKKCLTKPFNPLDVIHLIKNAGQ